MFRVAPSFSLLQSRVASFPATRASSSSLSFKRVFSNSSELLNRTECYDYHVQLGGKMVPFAGFSMPLQYSSLGTVAAHKHTRTQAGLFDVSHMAQLEVRGEDRVEFLERVLVGGIKELEKGTGTLTLITNDKGGIIDDTVISNQGEHHYMVINASRVAEDIRHLEKQMRIFQEQNHNRKDVSLKLISRHLVLNEFGPDYPAEKSHGTFALFALQGPQAAYVLDSIVTDSDRNTLKQLKFLNSAEITFKKECSVCVPNISYYNTNLEAVESQQLEEEQRRIQEEKEAQELRKKEEEERKKKAEEDVENQEEEHVPQINYYLANLPVVEKKQAQTGELLQNGEVFEFKPIEEPKEQQKPTIVQEEPIEESEESQSQQQKNQLEKIDVQLNYYCIEPSEPQEQSQDSGSEERDVFSPCLVTRCGYTGEDGFEIRVRSEEAEDMMKLLLSVQHFEPENQGIDHLLLPPSFVVQPIGLGARDSLRLEAAMCLYGHDIDETTTPVEACLTWTIPKRRQTEGGFLGSKVILKQIAEGVSRKRVGFVLTGAGIPREGDEIHDEQGNKIGNVTSGGFSPILNKGIGMGYVSTSASTAGTKISIFNPKTPNKTLKAKVTRKAFIQTKYLK